MKRLIKFIFNLILAVVAVALTLGILLFLNPSWQKAAVEEVLARDTERKWQVENVALGLEQVELEEVFMLEGEVGAEAKLVQVNGPLWKAPFSGLVEIESGIVSGLEVDLSQVNIGPRATEDYQTLLKNLSKNEEFWKGRIELVLGKFAATGFALHVRNTLITGRVLMPGNKIVDVNWVIVDAHSDAPRMIKIEPGPSGLLEL
ncbi:MAG: hypothetical protein AB3N63_10550 [Puniceicoccaceae bacterium]